MAFHVRCEHTDRLVRQLAKQAGAGITDVIRDAVREKLERQVRAIPLKDRLRALQAEIDAHALEEAQPAGRAAGILYITGPVFASILASDPGADVLCDAIDAAKRLYTSASASYQGALLLMEKAGIEAGHAKHKVDAMITLSSIRVLPASERVDAQALVLAQRWRRECRNEPVDHYAIMDQAYCTTMRVAPTMLEAIRH